MKQNKNLKNLETTQNFSKPSKQNKYLQNKTQNKNLQNIEMSKLFT
jgi:hypothetical protein